MNTLYAIEEVVPHRQDMCLLERITHWDQDTIEAELVVPDAGLFVEEGQVPAWVGIEYMAQTIAAGAGLSARDKGDQAGRTGFLLGCRNLSIAVDSFQIGDRLTVEARRTWGENQIGSFACKVQRGSEVLVEGALTVYQGPLPEDMIR